MKKSIYLFTILFGTILVGCNPLEDIHNEVNADNSLTVSGDVILTLSDDDYEDLGLNFGNFNSEEEAKDLLPDFLSIKYPALGEGSSALVTFDIYAPKREERSIIRYTVTTEDYDSNPETERFNNFDDMDQIYDLLNVKYPSPSDRTLVSLTYKYYDGSTNTLNNGFLYINDGWEFILGFTDDEYETMGEGFPNFTSEDEAIVKIPVFLKDKFKYDPKAAGDIVSTMYKLYTTDVDDLDEDGRTDDSTTYSFVKYFIFDGSEWSEYNDVISFTIQLGHDGSTWVPDNTIKYTLETSDYTLIVESLSATYPNATTSMDNYGNFERRPGNSAEWTDQMIAEAIGFVLDRLDPNAADGQKYVVTFDVYNGSSGTENIAVIKTGGIWVLQ